MSSIQKSIQQITALEELAHRDNVLNKINPGEKLIITLIYIISVVSFHPTDISGLLIFACVPVFLMIIGEIPVKPLLLRCLIALPFALFAGLSNLLLDRTATLFVGGFMITTGMITFTTLILKTILTVTAVLILMATTSMNELINALVSLHVPSLIVVQLVMTYRYMSVLAKEASLMYHAYLLRAPGEKGIKLVDMGSFLGQLILRSTDRAERIYHAMQCRGFEGRIALTGKRGLNLKSLLMIVIASTFLIALRLINISGLIGNIIIR